jgi:cobalt-zinc-cadmium efflux system outer membrane protein
LSLALALRRGRWAVAPFALLAASKAAAEPPPPPPRAAPVSALLRDDRAIGAWISQRHHDLLAAQARLAQARAEVGNARVLLPNPQLDVGVGGIGVGPANAWNRDPKGNVPSLNFGNTTNYNVGLTQTIELGKRGPRVDAAELRAEGSGQAFLDTLGDRTSAARTALARVAYLKAKMALLEDNREGAKRVADLQKARLDKGAVSGNDYDRLILDNITLEFDIARARADLESAISACTAVMLSPCDAAGSQIGDVDAAAPVPAQLAAAQADLDKRPDVKAARLESQAAEKDAVLAERRAIPDPSVRVGYTRDTYTAGGGQPNTLQVTVTIPLPIFDHGQHDAAKARAKALEQTHLANGMVNAARSDLAGLLTRKAFLETSLRTLDSVAVPKSTGILEATSKAFDQGQVSMTELLLARRTHLSLVLSQMDLHFEHFSVRSDLRHTLGLDTAGLSAPVADPREAQRPRAPARALVGSR